MAEVTVRDAGPVGMVTLRADLAAPEVAEAVRAVAGVAVPGVRRAEMAEGRGALWMSPDELLLLVPAGEAGAAVARIDEMLGGAHHLAVDVSDARAVIAVEGEGLREVIAKLAPVDMAAAAFPPGSFRRTRLGQVAAAFWIEEEGRARVICFRSVAEYVRALLAASASGGAVGFL